MSTLQYNKLILKLQSKESVGSVLSDPMISNGDIKKAITTGSPIVRLKLLHHCLGQPRYRTHLMAFFEHEALNPMFGQTALKWIDAFPKYAREISALCVHQLQPIHYKNFITACAQRVSENPWNDTPYNQMLMHDVFRLRPFTADLASFVLDQFQTHSLEWKSIIAVKTGHCLPIEHHGVVLNFIKSLPSMKLGTLTDMLYDFATPERQTLLQMCLDKVSLCEFEDMLEHFQVYRNPEQFEIFNNCVPKDLAFKKLFFEKMQRVHEWGGIDDTLYSKIERTWLEANISTTPLAAVKRKM